MAKEISLYIHLPFCRRKCPYCSFFVLPYKAENEALLIEAILAHLELLRQHLLDRTLVSVYFGGGTPSVVCVDSLKLIIEKIHTLFPNPNVGVEWTIEANPEDITLDIAKSYIKMGLNRVSLGVQSFLEHELVFLGRKAKKPQSIQAIETLYQAGFANISIDLIFELMNQSIEDFEKTLQIVENLPISHLSLYNLLIEEGSSFFRKKESLEKNRPSSEEGAKMLEKAVQKLEQYGFERYEISAFCKHNLRSVHNTGYWTGREFYGIGPSAWSFIDQKRFQCVQNLSQYYNSVLKQDPLYCFSETLDFASLLNEQIGLNLRLKEGVTKERIQSEQKIQTIDRLKKRGWVGENKSHYFLTETGKLFYDSVQMELL